MRVLISWGLEGMVKTELCPVINRSVVREDESMPTTVYILMLDSSKRQSIV